MAHRVSEFFDRQAEEYYEDPSSHPMAPFHRQTADRLQQHLDGRVLCVGGLWDLADLSKTRCRIVVTDVSRGMLEHQAEAGVAHVVSDGLRLAFGQASFDEIVLPLVLHHIAGTSVREARANVRRVVAGAARVLKPGGRLWISELCPSATVYQMERALSPLTRVLLRLADIPFVVMHSPGFYRGVLEAAGFSEVSVARVRSRDARPTDWLEPILGLPWLRVPRFMFPVNATVISGHR